MSAGSGRLANKFLGLGLIVAIAVIVPIVPLVQDYGQRIADTEKERAGVVVHKELRLVLQDLQRHRGATTSLLSGKEEFRGRADKARSGVDAALPKVEAALAATVASLGKAEGWGDFKAAWQGLRGGFSGLSPQANAKQHTELVTRLLAIMGDVADRSGLVLDPELDSYYMMDLAIVQTPPTTERLGQSRALGTLVLAEKSLTQERRDAIIGALAEMHLRQQAIETGAAKVFAANASAKGRLAAPFAEAKDGIGLFISNAERNILRADSLNYEAARYFDETTRAIDASFKLYDDSSEVLDGMLEQRVSHLRQERLLVLAGVLLFIGVAAGFAIFMLRRINDSIVMAAEALDQIAGGRLDVPLVARSNDEIGHLISRLDDMQGQLKTRLERERSEANENLRVKVALDVTSNNVMVADPEGKIIYCNAAVLEMMRQAESDLRQHLPNFRADGIVGSNFDIYHRNPAHQRNVLGRLQGVHRSEIHIGGRYFSLVASPIINGQGERLGTVVEWRDRTGEVHIEQDIAGIINAAVAGDFSKRLDGTKMSGFFEQLASGINQLLEANSRALTDVGVMLAKLSAGDLTHKIDNDYQGLLGQVKDDANGTVDHLREILDSIRQATDAINIAAQEIASGNQDLSSRTEEQASSLEETASSMEQLTGTVRQNAENARQANELANVAQQVAERGGAVVSQVVHTMSSIHQASSKIADIIGVIDGIAFQTNILALNAAVEAARAGEQGRGFAVVATEVRSLAQRSAGAAKEIKGLISDSVERVGTGSKLVDQAGQTMEEVVASIKQVAQIMADISTASREQSSGIEQIGIAVSQMDEMTQQNAALVEEAAAAAESLEEQARTLADSVAVFKLGDGAGRPLVSGGQRRAVAPRVGKPAALAHRAPARLTASEKPRALSQANNDEWEEF